jgi:signal transduction histidine kinase
MLQAGENAAVSGVLYATMHLKFYGLRCGRSIQWNSGIQVLKSVDHKRAAPSGKSLRALVLEDDPADFEILVQVLMHAGYAPQCTRVDTEAAYLPHLVPGIDVILCDYSLRGWSALRALELYQVSRLDVPFIVISDAVSEEIAVECMRRGAADYLFKDRLGRLRPAIEHAIEDTAKKHLAESLAARLLMAQEDERRRISRELHDQVGQTITLLGIELKKLRDTLAPGDPIHPGLELCVRLAEGNGAIVRDIALLLRPSMLDDLGLVPALNWQAREVFRRTGMEVRVDAEDLCNLLPDNHRTCIFRVVQEALHNASRHARAAHAYVAVRQEALQVRLLIEDDGQGFDVRSQKGMGLLGMEERVRYLGGEFQIDSNPGNGTSITILLPHPASASTQSAKTCCSVA